MRIADLLWSVAWFSIFWGFIITKATGHIFADWSWWWLFLPYVPWIGIAVKHFGL